LNKAPIPRTDAIQAVQAYYAFAEQRFTDSCRGMPGASLAFYGLARTCVSPGTQVTHAAGKAAMLQRVALAIAPQNVLAANELGVLLAEHGQLDEAERLFRRCLETSPTPETWRNLAVVHARKGDGVASQAALTAAEALDRRHAQPVQSDTAATEIAGQRRDGAPGADRKRGFFEKFSLSKLRGPFWR
jgi:Tfp pilus assembly protein PilF